MCGIVGLWMPGGFAEEPARRVIGMMRDALAHRGPDDSGTWLDTEAGIALGFRRLAILDLSPAGHQPMASADGRWRLVFNGEAYNFAEIRAEIEAVRGPHAWQGHSDTEVVLEAIALWGVEGAVRRINGMFALAAWDRQERSLTLARDRMGKKPLYCGWAGRSLLFASELKALRRHPDFDDRPCEGALLDVLRLGYVLGPHSIFAAIRRLPGGHLLRIGPDATPGEIPASTPYWSLREVALAGLEAQAMGRAATVEEFEATLEDAVRLRMVADVPVGAFLSGGIDSSLVTAVMAARAPGAVQSFSIGFAQKAFDEAEHARAVARHLGTRHEELYVGPSDLASVVPELPRICDEPLADDSLIPTTLLSRMTRRHVTVALSGDGGDELFAGYPRYANAARRLARRDALPAPLRHLATGLLGAAVVPALARWGQPGALRHARLLRQLLADADPERFNEGLMAHVHDPGAWLAGRHPPHAPLDDAAFRLGTSTVIDRMTFADAASFLTDDILVKVDRASMSASLEVRCPLLDHRIVALSWRFPTDAKCAGGTGKLPLRELLYRRVPRAIVDRPKQGFGAPVGVWLRHELRDWAEALMSPAALARNPVLNGPACRGLWEGFAQHGRGWDRTIWNLLVIQAWWEAKVVDRA